MKYIGITQKRKFKYKPMLPYNHVYESHAACLPAHLTGSAEPCCLKTCDLCLFTITTQTFPSSFCIKGQNTALFNSRQDDTLHACSFHFCIDIQTAQINGLLCCHSKPDCKLESNFILKYNFNHMCPWDCRRRRYSHLAQRQSLIKLLLLSFVFLREGRGQNHKMSQLGFLPSPGYPVLNKIPVSIFVSVKGDFAI